ncbi:hypothetical protein HAX54_006477, partial [Datura stramonium]|nr:hypothetical protein [Datura stramonium]
TFMMPFTPRFSPMIEIQMSIAILGGVVPRKNTVLTSVGELSISLWDLYIFGGLPIGGSLYEEVILEATELTVMLSEKCKGKGHQLLIKAPTEQVYDQDYHGGKGSFLLSVADHVSKKRLSQGESNSSREDHCWKNVRTHSDRSGDADLVMVEIHDSVDSPSRTLTILIKESPSIVKTKKEAASVPRNRMRARLSSDLQKHPTAAMSMFDEKKEVQVILDKIDGKDVDVSPLMKLLKSFFELAAISDQARSALHDKDTEAARKELSITAGEVKEKIEKLHRKEKDLEVLLEDTKKEVEEAKLGVSTAEIFFDACNDADLLNSDDLTDLEQKKECLEAT